MKTKMKLNKTSSSSKCEVWFTSSHVTFLTFNDSSYPVTSHQQHIHLSVNNFYQIPLESCPAALAALNATMKCY